MNILVTEFASSILDTIDTGGRTLVLDVKEGRGLVTESTPVSIVDSLNKLIQNESALLSEISIVQDEFSSIVVKLKHRPGHFEIIMFENDSELIPFLYDADLSNTWEVS
jgi:hypothetical protein